MMEQKPVAWMWLQNGKPVNAFLHDPDVRDEYWQKKQYSKRPLFTADQLKAERELGRNEAMENKITSGMELLSKHNVPTIGELLKAEREKAIQTCLKIAEEYRNSNYEDAGNVIYKNILALLSNNEEEPE